MAVPKKTVIFDIDGTIADIAHRREFLQKIPPDWRRFNDSMGDDTPNEPVVALYKVLWRSQQFELVLATGRKEESRKVTEQWLVWNNIPFNTLLMRADGDARADNLIKEEILDKLLADGAQIAFVVDDRQQVVDMWRRRGIVCLQCDIGDF